LTWLHLGSRYELNLVFRSAHWFVSCKPETFSALKKILSDVQCPLFYLAIPPSLFEAVVNGLKQADCLKGARIALEKPFGKDLKSAQHLNKILHQSLPEESIFRIDHYLGKEAVQNLTYFHCANPVFEASRNNKHIASVQIMCGDEEFDVSDRAPQAHTALSFKMQTGKALFQGEVIEFVADHAHIDAASAYEKLLGDAIVGNVSLQNSLGKALVLNSVRLQVLSIE